MFQLLACLALPLLVNAAQDTTEQSSLLLDSCCKLLDKALPHHVVFPNSTDYVAQEADYYAGAQADLLPACRVSPSSPKDISKIVSLASKNNCRFAVKGGGHMSWPGSSNIGQSGFTIDLRSLKGVTLSKDKKTVLIAAGSRWTEVYNVLDKEELSTVGGRSAGVGVGGFLAHGGVSFLSMEHGLGSDNIVQYQLVLANGDIVEANQHEHSDLYWALKAGSTNFGIITRYDMTTIPLGKLWAGTIIFNATTDGLGLLENLSEAIANMNEDPKGMTAVGFTYTPELKDYVVWAPTMYSKPVEFPPLLEGLKKFTPLSSSMRFTNLSDFTDEIRRTSPQGGRTVWFTYAYKNNAQITWDLFQDGRTFWAPFVEKGDVNWSVTVQALNSRMFKAGSSKNGGNPTGLTGDDGDLVLFLGATFWQNADEDEVMIQKTKEWQASVEAQIRAREIFHPFVYMNYANGPQKPYEAFGEANVRRLKSIQKKYDPKNTLGKLWKGGYKL